LQQWRLIFLWSSSSVPSTARRPDNIIIRHGSLRAASRERTQNVKRPCHIIIMYILYYIHTYWISGLYIHCVLNIISNLSTINTPTRLSDPTRFGRRKVKDKSKNTVTVFHAVHIYILYFHNILIYTYARIRACMWWWWWWCVLYMCV